VVGRLSSAKHRDTPDTPTPHQTRWPSSTQIWIRANRRNSEDGRCQALRSCRSPLIFAPPTTWPFKRLAQLTTFSNAHSPQHPARSVSHALRRRSQALLDTRRPLRYLTAESSNQLLLARPLHLRPFFLFLHPPAHSIGSANRDRDNRTQVQANSPAPTANLVPTRLLLRNLGDDTASTLHRSQTMNTRLKDMSLLDAADFLKGPESLEASDNESFDVMGESAISDHSPAPNHSHSRLCRDCR
jgi:hypothetical protein